MWRRIVDSYTRYRASPFRTDATQPRATTTTTASLASLETQIATQVQRACSAVLAGADMGATANDLMLSRAQAWAPTGITAEQLAGKIGPCVEGRRSALQAEIAAEVQQACAAVLAGAALGGTANNLMSSNAAAWAPSRINAEQLAGQIGSCVVARTPKPKPPPRISSGGNCPNGGYTNVDGNYVCSPYSTADGGAPAGATAKCRDGTYSSSQNRRGTCSHHGGVAQWL